MNLVDLVNRAPVPAPWAEGDNIPWDEPAFSQRMLKEHLSQQHDAASRRTGKIEQQVAWIHSHLLEGRTGRVLDLGCGPGLYSNRLAQRGHTCQGIDFSPASIAYAVQQADAGGWCARFRHDDIRRADYGSGYDLAMLIFGEFNVFCPADARLILRKARAALAPGGRLLLEVSHFAAVKQIGLEPPSWFTSPAGLFSDRPHLRLQENHWDDASRTATTRHIVVDAATAAVTRYAASYQAYTEPELEGVLVECGFGWVVFHPSLVGVPDDSQSEFFAVVAEA